MTETGFKITGVRLLREPVRLKRGAEVVAEFDVEARGFRFEDCRIYRTPDCRVSWWPPRCVHFPRELRGPVKKAIQKAYQSLRAA